MKTRNTDNQLLESALYEATLNVSAAIHDTSFECTIEDRDVIAAILMFEKPEVGLAAVLKSGAYGVQAASMGVDVQAVRKDLERAVERAETSLAALQKQLDKAIGADGPLAAALRLGCNELGATLNELMADQGDPDVAGSFAAKIHAATKRLDEMLASTRKDIAADMQGVVERQNNMIGKALRELRDLEPGSAIGRAFQQVEQRLVELSSALVAMKAAAAERHRGTAKGFDFEEQVAIEVARIACQYGDAAERTGAQGGLRISNKRSSNRGDVTCLIDGAPGIVIECMDRAPSTLTAKAVIAELDEAMRNRSAKAAIAVVSSCDASVMCGQPLQVLGTEKLAVVLDKDDPNLIALQVAYRLARTTLTTPQKGRGTDFDSLKGRISDLNTRLDLLSDIKTQLKNIADSGDRATAGLQKLEREVRNAVRDLLDTLEEENDVALAITA